jgi:hypothetical protein
MALLRSRDPIHGQGFIYLDSGSSDVVWISPNMLRAKNVRRFTGASGHSSR